MCWHVLPHGPEPIPHHSSSLQQSQAEALAVCIWRRQQQTWQKCVTRGTTMAVMAQFVA